MKSNQIKDILIISVYCMCECAALMLTQNRCEPNDLGM